MKTTLSLLSAIVFALISVCGMPAQAGPVYEGFNYSGGQDLTTTTSTATGLGDWTSSTGGIVGTTNSTGLSFGNLSTSGGSVNVTKPMAGGWQFLSAPITASGAIADGSDLFGSYLFKFVGPDGGENTSSNFGVSVGDSTGADHTISHLAKTYLRNPNNARIGYTDADYSEYPSGPVFDSSTYLFIGKWTNLGGGSDATGWVLTAANFAAISGDGSITEAELNANNQATGIDSGTAGTFGTAQFVKIGDYMDADGNYNVDEIRFADSLNGVVPIVPEPASLALLAGSLGMLLIRRR